MSVHARLVNGPRAGDDMQLTRPVLSMEFAELPDIEIEQTFAEGAVLPPKFKQHRYTLAKVLYLYEYAGSRETGI